MGEGRDGYILSIKGSEDKMEWDEPDGAPVYKGTANTPYTPV